MKKFLFILCLFPLSLLHSQRHAIDSVLVLIKSDKLDSNRVKHLNSVAFDLYVRSPDSTILLSSQAAELSHRISYLFGEATSLGIEAIGYYVKGDYTNAIDLDLKSLKVYETMKDKKNQEVIIGNVASIYLGEKDSANAASYFSMALNMAKELKDSSGISRNTANLGINYLDEKNLDKALKCFRESEKYEAALHHSGGVARMIGNIGTVFLDRATLFVNPDDVKRALLDSALHYFMVAVDYKKQAGDKVGELIWTDDLGETYIHLSQYTDAEKCMTRALALANELGDWDELKKVHRALAVTDSVKGNMRSAFAHLQLAEIFKDSSMNDDNVKKQTRLEMQYRFYKKSSADSIRFDEQSKKEQLKHDSEIAQEHAYTIGGTAGAVLMLIVAVVSIRAFQNKKKANSIIEHQKSLVEEKQREILDSIYYARRIQRSMLPPEKFVDAKLRQLKKQE